MEREELTNLLKRYAKSQGMEFVEGKEAINMALRAHAKIHGLPQPIEGDGHESEPTLGERPEETQDQGFSA